MAAPPGKSAPERSAGLPFREVGLAWLLSRLWVAFFVYVGHLSHPYMEKIPGGWSGADNWWLNPWTLFDSQHFVAIAQGGYTPVSAAFFPLYPLLLRLGGSDPVSMAAAGVLISNAALLGALFLFARLASAELGVGTARWSLWLLAFFPLSAIFSAVYTESLFLLLILASFVALRRGSFALAAACALAAALTRNSGLVLAAALAFDGYRCHGPKLWKPVAAVALAPLLGFLGVQGYFAARFGAAAGLASQRYFFRAPCFPWTPVLRDTASVLSGKGLEFTSVFNLLAALAGIAFAAVFALRGQWAYAVLLGCLLLMSLCLARTIPSYTNGSLRYMMTTFPFTLLLAQMLEPRFGTRKSRSSFAASWLLVNAVGSYLVGVKSFPG